MERYDVVIVGAGPAGLCLARELASPDISILVLDKKKDAGDVQYNTSGSYIQPQEWNLPQRLFNPVTSVYVASAGERTRKPASAYVINRMELLRYLERDAKARGNVIVEYLAIIDYIEFTATGVASVSYRQNAKRRTATGTIFADCSGMGVVLSKRAIVPLRPTLAVGIEYLVPLKREPHTIDLFVDSELKGGYGWIFPLNSKTAIVGFGTLCEDSFKDIESSLQKMWQIPRVSERCALKPSRRDISVLRTGKPLKRFSAGNVVVIGDAAIQANPLAGEGIRFVMDAARTAAKSIRAALRTHDLGKLQEYDHAWSKKYRRKYLLAERLQRAIKRWSNDDKKLDAGVRVLARLPDETFARLLSGDINYLLLAKIAAVALVSRNK